MSLIIEIDHSGTLKGAQIRIERLEHNATHMEDAFWDVYFQIIKWNEQQFDTLGHGSWSPLDDDTVIKKEKAGIDPRPLRGASGRLFASLAGLAAPDRIIQVSGDRLYFASTVPYGPIHMKGSQEKNIPIRKPMDITRGRRSHITRLIRRGVLSGD